jgi:hypothetical protein
VVLPSFLIHKETTMRESKRLPFGAKRMSCAGRGIAFMMLVGVASLALAPRSSATGLNIVATFDNSITSNSNAVAIENDINTAIVTIDGLYSNAVTVPVTFSYTGLTGNTLLQTQIQALFPSTYTNYVNLLQADSAANPANLVLAQAIAHLGTGNTGGTNTTLGGMAIDGAQWGMLGNTNAFQGATITINSNQPFALTGPANPSSTYDLVGGLEHELDEVLGGGGVGSMLNNIANPTFCPGSPFCTQQGSTDLYRYSAPGRGSFTTSTLASSYFSIDGGATSIVAFNQGGDPVCPGGDFGDFAPTGGTGGGTGQLIQNACNFFGPDEAYTTSSPEYTMLEAIGWNPASAGTVPAPEPSTLILLGTGLALAAYKRRKLAL